MKSFLPKDKFDFESLQILKETHPSIIIENSSKLLEWLQDLHWPVSHEISRILRPLVNDIKNQIIFVLQSDEADWKYNVIYIFFVEAKQKIDIELKNELVKIIDNPTYWEKEEEVDRIARESIEHFKLNNF
jgi:hypothetical protein